MTTPLGEILTEAGVPERISKPDTETFVTIKLNGGGAVRRHIKPGKTPIPFTGYRLKSGQFIYSRIDARNGAFAIVPPELDNAVVSKDFPPFAIDSTRVTREYLEHFFRGGSLQSIVRAQSFGATNRQRIKEDAFLRLPISLPSLDNQRRITSILDEADAIRAKRRSQLAHLDELPQALFHEMFSSTPLSSTLADHLSFLTSGSRGWAKYYSAAGAKFLRIQNVKDGRLDLDDLAYVDAPETAEARRTRVQPGDVLLSITADLGRVAAIPPNFGHAHINQHLALIRAPSIDPDFLATYLNSPRGQREILGKDRGATKAGLNFDDVRSVRVPTPPLADQKAFASKLAQVRTERDRVARALQAGDELFASLQCHAFRGEL